MATIRHCFGRVTNNFVHKTCSRYLPRSQNNSADSAIRGSPLTSSFLLGEIQHVDVCGAENAADRVTVGVPQDSCVRIDLTPGPVDDSRLNRNTEDYYQNFGCNKAFLRTDNTQKETSRYRSSARYRPTRLQGQCLCLGHGHLVCVRAYSGNGAHTEPLFKTKTGYYDILEVSPAATRAQIKTAYYKQSFIYHPDRNAGSDAATARFSDINEAYTVLGNKALRKKYDRGLLTQSDLVSTTRPTGKEATGSSGKQHTGGKRSMMGADSRGGVYDFDKFFKEHYQEQLQRDVDTRARKEKMLKKERETIEEMRLDWLIEIGIGVMLVIALGILMSLKRK